MLAKKGFFNQIRVVNNFVIWLKKKTKEKVFPGGDEQFIVDPRPRIASLSKRVSPQNFLILKENYFIFSFE